MPAFNPFLIILLLVHTGLAIYAISKLAKTNMLSKGQKVANTVLIVVVPLLWSVLIYYILRKERGSYEVAIKNDRSSNNFHESGIGTQGTGIGNHY